MSECSLCQRQSSESYPLPFDGEVACRPCVSKLGEMLGSGSTDAQLLWPAVHDPDEDEPEPMVTLPDGRRVELRAHTENMKKDLTVEQRAELSDTYSKLGLYREAVLEAALTLKTGASAEAITKALTVLFSEPLGNAETVRAIRRRFLPN